MNREDGSWNARNVVFTGPIGMPVASGLLLKQQETGFRALPSMPEIQVFHRSQEVNSLFPVLSKKASPVSWS